MMETLEGDCGSRSRERERESRVELPVEFSAQNGLFCCRTVRFSTAGARRQPKLPDPLKRSSDELSSFFRRTETKEEVMRSLNHVADKSQSRFLLLYCFGTSDAFWRIVSVGSYWETENAMIYLNRFTQSHDCITTSLTLYPSDGPDARCAPTPSCLIPDACSADPFHTQTLPGNTNPPSRITDDRLIFLTAAGALTGYKPTGEQGLIGLQTQ